MFADSRCQDCPDTVISIVAYIVFRQVGPIDHCTHVPGPFNQPSTKSEYIVS